MMIIKYETRGFSPLKDPTKRCAWRGTLLVFTEFETTRSATHNKPNLPYQVFPSIDINIRRRSPNVADYWNVSRYGSFPFEGLDGFVIMNVFQANHLSAYPPSSTMLPELSCALRMIVFALEQDLWNYTPVLSYSRHNNRYGTGHIQMLNVGSNKIRGFFYATNFV